jgi:glyoxalase family protein
MQLYGIHHLTAVTADAPGNHRFYTEVLGLRLVKKTVNQDDVSAYHLFYADGKGSPGTDLTFFDWPVARERRGSRSIVETGLRVGSESVLEWWRDRLAAHGAAVGQVQERNQRAVLDFEDPEGQRLSLVVDGGAGEAHPWERSSVPPEKQIRGLGPVVLSVSDIEGTHLVLKSVLEMKPTGKYERVVNGKSYDTHVYQMGGVGGPASEVHLLVQPDLPAGHPGAGGVHHVAFRTVQAEYREWAERLGRLRIPNSGPVDRFYFQSLYFREPNGILFEIATDEPGFAADEPMESLGEKLALPPFLEPRRAAIEAGLKPL